MRPTVHHLGIGIGLLSITFFFGALILAYYFRLQTESVWQRFDVPDLLWVSTVVLCISSWILEAGRHALRRGQVSTYRARLAGTIVLAAVFLGTQAVSAVQLLAQGVTAQGNPHGSVFYVFMTLHGAHLVGGMAWLAYLYLRAGKLLRGSENDLRRHRMVASTVAIYWHFMGVLWLVLFYLLEQWSRS